MENQPIDATIIPDVVTVEILSGHPEGYVDANGETIVADKDDNGNVIGWHKEPAEGVK